MAPDMHKKVEREWNYAGDSRNWPAGSWTRKVERKIKQYWADTYDEEGVERTIKIDESERPRMARELAEYLKR